MKENLLQEQKRSLKGKLEWQRSKSGSENSILGTAAWSGSGVIEKSRTSQEAAVLLLALMKENLLQEQKRSLKGKLEWQRSKSGSENSILGTTAWSGSGVIEKSLIKVWFLRYGVKFVENTRTRFKE